ncbi:MAG: FAD-dependent oxidoreductase [Phycisphaera sp.]|nr:MAG: FAD-dependent oxidoreductase [Phycisphaera sp.]
MPDSQLTLFGANWCPDCRNTKVFLGEMGVSYLWVDVDANPDANERIASLNNGKRVIPTIELADGGVMVNPSNAELADALGIQREAKREFYDLIVIGSGPAGLTAALYAAREGQDVLVIDKGPIGGQVATTDRLDNFPGFPEGIEGREFSARLGQQAERFGVEVLTATEVTGLQWSDSCRTVRVAGGREYGAAAVLLATGSTYRRLNVTGEDEFVGAGVHFCATCDGPFYKGKHVAVIGGGNSAGEESLFLTRFADRVTLLVREDAMTASKLVADKVAEHDAIEVRYGTTVSRFEGDGLLERVVTKGPSGEQSIEVPGVFLFIGLQPNTGWLPDSVERDQGGFLTTNASMQTNIAGVFAAGDVRAGSTKQAASSAGEGAAAALMIRDFLKRRPDLSDADSVS